MAISVLVPQATRLCEDILHAKKSVESEMMVVGDHPLTSSQVQLEGKKGFQILSSPILAVLVHPIPCFNNSVVPFIFAWASSMQES